MNNEYKTLEQASAVVQAAKEHLLRECLEEAQAAISSIDRTDAERLQTETNKQGLIARSRMVGFLLGTQWFAREIFQALDRDGFMAEGKQFSEAYYLIEAVLKELHTPLPSVSTEDMPHGRH